MYPVAFSNEYPSHKIKKFFNHHLPRSCSRDSVGHAPSLGHHDHYTLDRHDKDNLHHATQSPSVNPELHTHVHTDDMALLRLSHCLMINLHANEL